MNKDRDDYLDHIADCGECRPPGHHCEEGKSLKVKAALPERFMIGLGGLGPDFWPEIE